MEEKRERGRRKERTRHGEELSLPNTQRHSPSHAVWRGMRERGEQEEGGAERRANVQQFDGKIHSSTIFDVQYAVGTQVHVNLRLGLLSNSKQRCLII